MSASGSLFETNRWTAKAISAASGVANRVRARGLEARTDPPPTASPVFSAGTGVCSGALIFTNGLFTRTVTKNFRYMRCVRFDRWRGATKEHSRQRSVTEEQRSHRSNLAQPSGLPSFSPLPALLAPHRPLTGMLVARALAATKNPGNACIENSLSQY